MQKMAQSKNQLKFLTVFQKMKLPQSLIVVFTQVTNNLPETTPRPIRLGIFFKLDSVLEDPS